MSKKKEKTFENVHEEVKFLRKQVAALKGANSKLKADNSKILQKYADTESLTKAQENKIVRCTNAIAEFNSLPWYKRLFRKIHVE